MTGDPDKEYRKNKPPPTWRVRERSKRDTACLSTFPESLLLTSTLAEQCMRHQERLWIRMIGQRPPGKYPITIKTKTASHAAEQFSWVPLLYCFPPRCPFSIKYLAFSAHVSPHTIHFQVLDKSPVLGPGRGPPSCNSQRINTFTQTFLCFLETKMLF